MVSIKTATQIDEELENFSVRVFEILHENKEKLEQKEILQICNDTFMKLDRQNNKVIL